MSDPALIDIVSAATFFFATVMSLNLAIAIYRRAGKSFVVDNMVVILLLCHPLYSTAHRILLCKNK